MSALRSRNRPSAGWTCPLQCTIIQTAEVDVVIHADFHRSDLCILVWSTNACKGLDNTRGIVSKEERVTGTGRNVGVCSENEAAKGDASNVNIACGVDLNALNNLVPNAAA